MNKARITLAKVHHAKFASEETECFDALVLVDGKPCFTVSNEGHGGPDNQRPIDRKLFDELQALVATQPDEILPDLPDYPLKASLEGVVGDLLEAYLFNRRLSRRRRTHIAFNLPTDPPTMYNEIRIPDTEENRKKIKARYPQAVFVEGKPTFIELEAK